MKPDFAKLRELARSETKNARQAFELAHHARRLLEAAADTAARDRWAELVSSGARMGYDVARYAAACASASIKYPVQGEAKVYAALLDAVDTAHVVSDQLYDAWLQTQPREAPLPVPEGTNRLGAPLAPGCTRSFCAYDDASGESADV